MHEVLELDPWELSLEVAAFEVEQAEIGRRARAAGEKDALRYTVNLN